MGDGIHPYLLVSSIYIPKTPGNGFKQGFGIGHVVIPHKGSLGGHIGEGHHGSPFRNGIMLPGKQQDLMERKGGNIKGFKEIFIVQGIVGQSLANIR